MVQCNFSVWSSVALVCISSVWFSVVQVCGSVFLVLFRDTCIRSAIGSPKMADHVSSKEKELSYTIARWDPMC